MILDLLVVMLWAWLGPGTHACVHMRKRIQSLKPNRQVLLVHPWNLPFEPHLPASSNILSISPLLLVCLKRGLDLSDTDSTSQALTHDSKTHPCQECRVRQDPHTYMCQGLGHVVTRLVSSVCRHRTRKVTRVVPPSRNSGHGYTWTWDTGMRNARKGHNRAKRQRTKPGMQARHRCSTPSSSAEWIKESTHTV